MKHNELPGSCRDIPLPAGWTAVTRVKKGWSKEQKYRISTSSGQRFLLRLRPGGQLTSHRQEFDFISQLSEAGIPVPKPHLVGEAEGGKSTFMLLDWLEGQDLQSALPGLDENRQYSLGLEAGCILRRIHQSPRLAAPPLRAIRQKSLEKISKFEAAGLDIPGSEAVARFVRAHIGWLDEEALVCQHGDFHPGNLILAPDGSLGVIDFNRWDIGDPAEEFYKLQSFTIQASQAFAVGQLHGYFEGEPDLAFWQALAVHVAVSSLYSIRWALPFGESEVAGMKARCQQAMADYAGFTRLVPAWYKSRTQMHKTG